MIISQLVLPQIIMIHIDDEILCGVYLQQKKGKEYLSYCDRQIAFIDGVLAKYPHDDDYRKELLQQKKYWLEAK